MAQLNKVHEQLAELEKMVKRELTEQSSIRANATEGFDPGDF